MSDEWYYSRDGQEDGPFPYAVLQQMAKVGDLLATDKLREATAQEWRVAADFSDLCVTVEPRSVSSDSSSLKGLTMALGIEPAKPGHDPLLGCDIGGVTIVRLIAEGGMGRVYEGKQEKPKRTVAVKFMRPGLTSPSVLRRFEYEAEVLARLQHSGIAHIYFVGVHRMGNASVPYFIMEYIADARTLTKYADDLKLPTRQRLDLFRSVCDAVAHGHQKGVIHRDLKPTNILVDASGQPKVIDFGVARATDSDMALTTMQTDVGQLIGTLQYMSPEQFRADPNDIDVRSDVYAMGVILYELLAGKMPYDVKKKAVHEVARIVQEDDPTPLSNWNRALKGDVAVIAGKCLEKDRLRRYSSASELGSDIGRYLSGEPIAASPPRFIDGVLRLAQRHRAAAVATCAVMATLFIAILGVTYFAVKADRRRAEATKASEKAVAMEAKATHEKDIAVQRLYQANLYRVQNLIREKNYVLARKVLSKTADLRSPDALPIELSCCRAMCEVAPVLLEGHQEVVQKAAFSPDGSRLATASVDKTARLWDAVTGEQLLVLDGHSHIVTHVAFSPDGMRLATTSYDKTTRLWDATTGEQLDVLEGHEASVLHVAFSPDGMRLATTSSDKTARLWDATTGKQLDVLEGHEASVLHVAFSPDGMRLATASYDKTARLWNARTGEQLDVLEGHEASVLHAAFNCDGTRLATASEDTTARLWDAASGEQLAVLEGHRARVMHVAFSPDGTRLATASKDTTARLWDATTGEQLDVLEGHEASVLHVAFSPDGTRLATASEDTTARLWDLTTGEQLAVLEGHRAKVLHVAFSPDGTRLATASEDMTARLWDTTTGEQLAVLKGHEASVLHVAFSPDGNRLATASEDTTARLWDTTTGEQLAVLESQGGSVVHVTFNADGNRLATVSSDNNAQLWNATTGVQVAIFKRAMHVAFSPDGTRLATASEDTTARLWDAETGEKLRDATSDGNLSLVEPDENLLDAEPDEKLSDEDRLKRALEDLRRATSDVELRGVEPDDQLAARGHGGSVMHVAFSPDGARLATASEDTTARLWDAATGEQLDVLERHGGMVTFSSDGIRLATDSYDTTAWLWNAATGEQVAELKGHRERVMHVAFSPGGTRLATASEDTTARLWDAATGEQVAVLEGHGKSVLHVSFSPDGTRVATASEDTTARLWDAATGEQLAVLEGHGGSVTHVAFSPDGTRLATASVDNTARLWGVSNTEMHRSRQQFVATAERLNDKVTAWLRDGPALAGANLNAAKEQWPPDEYRVAGNLILSRCTGSPIQPETTAP